MPNTVTLALGRLARAHLGAVARQIADLEARRLDLLALVLEAHGHDPDAMTVTALDLEAGTLSAESGALAAVPDGD